MNPYSSKEPTRAVFSGMIFQGVEFPCETQASPLMEQSASTESVGAFIAAILPAGSVDDFAMIASRMSETTALALLPSQRLQDREPPQM